MFSWSTNFPDLYQLQGPDSDSVAFTTNFASDELSLEQPNVVPVRDNTTSNGAQVRPQLASPIQHRGNVSRLEPEQREEMMTSIPLNNDAGRRQETDTIFTATWDETSQNTASFNGIVQQLNNHTQQLNGDAQLLNRHAKQLDRLTKAVDQLGKSVSQLEERCNEARQRVEDIASALVNTDRHFRFLVQRLSTPFAFDASATANYAITDDADDPSSK